MREVLVIVPEEGLRDQLRLRLARKGGTIRARTYAHGLVLADEYVPDVAIVWSPSGADGEAIYAVQRLRKANRDMRIIVATPEFLKGGTVAFVEHLQVDNYLLDTRVDSIVAAAAGVPVIDDEGGNQSPPTVAGGSSAACH
jgi:hypothetical protein